MEEEEEEEEGEDTVCWKQESSRQGLTGPGV